MRTRDTQKREVIRYLKHHRSISTIEAANKLLIADLRSIIRFLKKEYNMSWKWEYKCNIYGRAVRFKRYKLANWLDSYLGYTQYGRIK